MSNASHSPVSGHVVSVSSNVSTCHEDAFPLRQAGVRETIDGMDPLCLSWTAQLAAYLGPSGMSFRPPLHTVRFFNLFFLTLAKKRVWGIALFGLSYDDCADIQ